MCSGERPNEPMQLTRGKRITLGPSLDREAKLPRGTSRPAFACLDLPRSCIVVIGVPSKSFAHQNTQCKDSPPHSGPFPEQLCEGAPATSGQPNSGTPRPG